MVKIWVISDTHFHHANILKFTTPEGKLIRPNFKDINEMDEIMVARWNDRVRPEDHVWHLGDVAFGKDLDICKRLLGHKRLILGNHDRFTMAQYKEAGFQKIMGARHFDRYLLTHYPVHPDSTMSGNIHGHIHERRIDDPRYVNVSVEQTDYAPVELDAMIEWLKKRQK